MYTIFAISVSLGLATLTSAGIYGGKELTLDFSGGGGGGGGGDFGGYGGGGGGGFEGGLGGHAALLLGGGGGGGGGGGSLYSGPSSYETSEQHGGGGGGGGGGGDNGDYHHGVSIIGGGGGGGDEKGATFDLTHHGWSGHHGPFGGSFVASAKYEGQSGVAHKISEGEGHGLIGFGSPHYTDVLGASQDEGLSLGGGGGGGGGGGWKWGVEASPSEY